MIRIALAEDNAMLAKTIQEKIALFPDKLKFKFHSFNGKLILEDLEKDSNIDVILMDIQMPEMNGIEATAMITEKFPRCRIIMLTVLDDEEHIFKAIQAGANGYLLKDVNPKELLEGIEEIMNGGAPMSAGIALKAMKLLRNPLTAQQLETKTPEPDFLLSAREVDVLTHLSKGFDYKQIAENLFISPATVRKHIENTYVKLQVHNKLQAVQKAQKHRLIE